MVIFARMKRGCSKNAPSVEVSFVEENTRDKIDSQMKEVKFGQN